MSRRFLWPLAAAAAAPWVFGLLAAWWSGGRWLLPFAAALTVFPEFARRVRAGDSVGAWRLGMAWAGALSAGLLTLTLARPDWAAAVIWNGPAYRDEMMAWIQTGAGRESDWRAFLPQHGRHAAVFVVLTLASGGYLGLALGAALLGYMNYFVGSYAALAPNAVQGIAVAWVPWSIVRVMAFVLLGAVFARPILLRRAGSGPWVGRVERRLLLLAGSGLLCDVLLKGLSAPLYGVFLRDLLAP